MPLRTFDFASLPLLRNRQEAPDYSAFENFIPNVLESYHAPKKLKEEREAAARKKKSEELANQFLENYGPREHEAGIAIKEAMAKNYERLAGGSGLGDGSGTSSRGLTSGLHAIRALPPAARENMLAQIRPLTPNMTDIERINLLTAGATLQDFRDEAKEKGIDIDNLSPQFSPTTSNVTRQKEQEGRGAELDFLETKVTEATAPYARRYLGVSPKEVFEGLTGSNTDERAKFLAGRALQPELAGARSAIAGGSNAHEALKDVKEAALGNFKVFESTVGPEVYKKTQQYINEWLKEGLKQRGKAIYNQPPEFSVTTGYERLDGTPIPVSELTPDQLKKLYRGAQ